MHQSYIWIVFLAVAESNNTLGVLSRIKKNSLVLCLYKEDVTLLHSPKLIPLFTSRQVMPIYVNNRLLILALALRFALHLNILGELICLICTFWSLLPILFQWI
jgi:hypothetical protein